MINSATMLQNGVVLGGPPSRKFEALMVENHVILDRVNLNNLSFKPRLMAWKGNVEIWDSMASFLVQLNKKQRSRTRAGFQYLESPMDPPLIMVTCPQLFWWDEFKYNFDLTYHM